MIIKILKMKQNNNSFQSDEKGVTTMEYGLLAVALASLIILVLYGNPDGFVSAVTAKFEQLTSMVKVSLL